MNEPETQSAVSSTQLVMRLREQANDLRIQENLKPYGDVCDEAAARLDKLESAWELLREYMAAEPSSERVKAAWENLEEWWKRNAA